MSALVPSPRRTVEEKIEAGYDEGRHLERLEAMRAEGERAAKEAAADAAPKALTPEQVMAEHRAGRPLVEMFNNGRTHTPRRMNPERRALKGLAERNDLVLSGRQKKKLRRQLRARARQQARERAEPETTE